LPENNKEPKMKVYNYSEARQNFTTVLNTALKEDVIIARKDGSKFKLVSIQKNKRKKSPLEDIKGIKTSIGMNDIIDAIRESRERS
jgi:PHD/YefM family antitoxin component YafN of YafNO toxin-antitoxin module